MPVSPSILLYRLATPADILRIHTLIDRSVRELQAPDYTPSQIEEALRTYLSLDTQLIADQTYFVVEDPRPRQTRRLLPAEVGPGAARSVAETPASAEITTTPDATAACSIRRTTLRRSAPSMYIPIGLVAASDQKSLNCGKTPPAPKASLASRWEPPSPACLSMPATDT